MSVLSKGTHYMWEGLRDLGIDVHHEGVGPDGAVSWLYAVKYDYSGHRVALAVLLHFLVYCSSHYNSTQYVEDIGRGYIINNPENLHRNRFKHIFHQVSQSTLLIKSHHA
jgi:hypothetical protein